MRVYVCEGFKKDDFKVQDKVVLAFKRMRDQQRVLEETEVLAKPYGKQGSEWRRHQENGTLDEASELAYFGAQPLSLRVVAKRTSTTVRSVIAQSLTSD